MRAVGFVLTQEGRVALRICRDLQRSQLEIVESPKQKPSPLVVV